MSCFLYCGASEKLCGAARKVAPEVKRRYHAWSVSGIDAFNDYGGLPTTFQFWCGSSAQGNALVARARKMAISRHVTRGRKGHPAWLKHANPHDFEYFPLELGGHLYVGAAGRWGIYPANRLDGHWLFMVFQAPNAGSHRLVPLAAFTVHRVTSGVRSITATNESASASETQSTSIPIF